MSDQTPTHRKYPLGHLLIDIVCLIVCVVMTTNAVHEGLMLAAAVCAFGALCWAAAIVTGFLEV